MTVAMCRGPRCRADEAGIGPASLDDAAPIDKMVANPVVIERPIVLVDGEEARFGRPPESVLDIL